MTFLSKIGHFLQDIWTVFTVETRRVFTDMGVILVFFVAGISYPILFNLVYRSEPVADLPIAVVDESKSELSRRFIHKIAATPEMNVAYHCNNMEEAKYLMQRRRVNGVIYFPSDYAECLNKLETAHVGIYCDMSSFLYYKAVLLGSNFVMLDEMKQIQLDRYAMTGLTGELADVMVTPLNYSDVRLYGNDGNFAAFLIPALLILVIHQTLFFGIGMLCGGAHEDKIEVELMPAHLRRRSVYRVVLGRALTYFLIYLPLLLVDLVLIPRIFGLPHIGHFYDLVLFILPFMLATIFFSMMVNTMVKERETGLLVMVFFSIVLLFLSGFAWPKVAMPWVWRVLSWVFPSTHGVQGYIRINSVGAGLSAVSFEYVSLWILTGIYFIGACAALRYINKHRPMRRRVEERREQLQDRFQEGMEEWQMRRERKESTRVFTKS